MVYECAMYSPGLHNLGFEFSFRKTCLPDLLLEDEEKDSDLEEHRDRVRPHISDSVAVSEQVLSLWSDLLNLPPFFSIHFFFPLTGCLHSLPICAQLKRKERNTCLSYEHSLECKTQIVSSTIRTRLVEFIHFKGDNGCPKCFNLDNYNGSEDSRAIMIIAIGNGYGQPGSIPRRSLLRLAQY